MPGTGELASSKMGEMDHVLPDMARCWSEGGVGAVRGSGLKLLRLSHLWCRFCSLCSGPAKHWEFEDAFNGLFPGIEPALAQLVHLFRHGGDSSAMISRGMRSAERSALALKLPAKQAGRTIVKGPRLDPGGHRLVPRMDWEPAW